MREKDVVGIIVTFDLTGLLPTNHIIILQWRLGVYEEAFDANMKIAQTTQNTQLKFYCQKVESAKEMANFSDQLSR